MMILCYTQLKISRGFMLIHAQWTMSWNPLRWTSHSSYIKVDSRIDFIPEIRAVQWLGSTDPPTQTEGPLAAPNLVCGQSRVGKWNNRIIRFRFGFKNISPEKPEPTELFIQKNIWFDMPIGAAQQCQPETQRPKFTFSHTNSQHAYQLFNSN